MYVVKASKTTCEEQSDEINDTGHCRIRTLRKVDTASGVFGRDGSRGSACKLCALVLPVYPQAGNGWVWVADITYLPTREKCVYLSLVTDAYSYYQALHERYGLTCSMTDGYDCYQNALAERVNGILKTEFLLFRPENLEQA